MTIGQATHDKLRYAQALLGCQVPSGDLAQVLDLALDALIRKLEARKFAATDRPRHAQGRPRPDGRHVPAEVRRAVWQRDGGRCTFVSDAGRRCPARDDLEFARGGEATVSDMRLRCRAHNQHQAERTFGAEFMRHKRLAAAEGRAAGTTVIRAGGASDRSGGLTEKRRSASRERRAAGAAAFTPGDSAGAAAPA